MHIYQYKIHKIFFSMYNIHYLLQTHDSEHFRHSNDLLIF